jgi:hypothetical protein
MKGLKCRVDFRLKDGRQEHFFNDQRHSFHGSLRQMQQWLVDQRVAMKATVFDDKSVRLYFKTTPEIVVAFTEQFIGPPIQTPCERKKSYPTEDAAMTGVFRTMMKPGYRAKSNHRLLPYRCPICETFHIGHQFGTLEYHAEN